MIIIGLLDDAFESNVMSIEDILRIRVRPPRHSSEFRWRANKLKTLIFRQAVWTPACIETSPVIALPFTTPTYITLSAWD
jgi:hypothetical protein